MRITLTLFTAILLLAVAISEAQPTFVWTRGAAMPTGKGGQVCGLVGGKMIVAGGTWWSDENTKHWTGDTYLYDPATDAWSDGPALPFPVSYGTGQSIDGKLYVVSGSDGERDYSHTMICVKKGDSYHWIWGRE